jgi:hypothetical protein
MTLLFQEGSQAPIAGDFQSKVINLTRKYSQSLEEISESFDRLKTTRRSNHEPFVRPTLLREKRTIDARINDHGAGIPRKIRYDLRNGYQGIPFRQIAMGRDDPSALVGAEMESTHDRGTGQQTSHAGE